MKKSEELTEEARKEENDLKALGLYNKALREKRSEKFEDWLVILKEKYSIEERKNGSFTIATQDYGKIDYFPKANKLLIRKDNDWIKPGLKWIINNLLN